MNFIIILAQSINCTYQLVIWKIQILIHTLNKLSTLHYFTYLMNIFLHYTFIYSEKLSILLIIFLKKFVLDKLKIFRFVS